MLRFVRILTLLLFGNIAQAQLLNETYLKYDVSVSSEMKNAFENDLKFLGSIKGKKSTRLHKEIFGAGTNEFPLDGNLYLNYFYQRIHSVRLDIEPNSFSAYVDVEIDPHEMVITLEFKKYDSAILAGLSTFIHEARHSEDIHDWWSHEPCPAADVNGKVITGNGGTVDLTGEWACDRTVYGAYGVAIIFLKNVAKFCDNCSTEERDNANYRADRLLTRIVNPVAYKRLLDDFADDKN